MRRVTHITLFTLVVWLLPPYGVTAQRKEQHRVDSFLAIVQSSRTTNDTVYATALYKLAFAYFAVDPDKGITYGTQALALAEALHWDKGIAMSATSLGANAWAKNNFVQALDYYQKSLTIHEKLKDSAGIATSLNNIAGAHFAQCNYAKAIDYYHKAIAINRQMGNKLKEQGSYQNMAETYEIQKQYVPAVEAYKKALTLNEQIHNTRNTASVLSRLGKLYTFMKDYATALTYEKEALRLFEVLNEQDDIASTNGNLGYTYQQSGNYMQAIHFYQQAIRLTQDQASKFAKELLDEYRGNLGRTYLLMAKKKAAPPDSLLLLKAKTYLLKFHETALSINDWRQLKVFLPDLAEVLALQGNYKEALAIHQAYSAFSDSLYNTQKEKEITRHELEFQFGRQQDSLRYAYNLQQSRLSELNKQKEVADLRLKQQWLYSILTFAAVLFGGLFWFFRSRIHTLKLRGELAKEKTQLALKEADYKNRLNDITYTALQSQMNPHFIFNCLNSIKLYAEQNNAQAASLYLTKFSRLIRMILEHSRAAGILLSSELDLLQLYLEMENMRFKDKLRFNIIVDSEVETDFIEIPPMLIQPYVENAIWHGLMHKPEGGSLSIHFALDDKEHMLHVTITDDGIGREKAAMLKSKITAQHRSYGMRVTAERIELLNEKHKMKASIDIEDLKDASGGVAGTKVTIKLPVK